MSDQRILNVHEELEASVALQPRRLGRTTKRFSPARRLAQKLTQQQCLKARRAKTQEAAGKIRLSYWGLPLN